MKKMMTRLASIAVVGAIALVGCGDNQKALDAAVHHDSTGGDAACSNCPAVPALGPQIDRLGRPAVNTALNHAFDGNAVAAGVSKDAYNQDQSPGGWVAAYAPLFGAPPAAGGPSALGILDVLDTGLTCTMGTCAAEAVPTLSDGCGNQVAFNGNVGGGGAPAATSYLTLAGLLADDQLYLDTGKTSCEIASSHANYLAVEFNVVTSGIVANTTCGGRAPTNDVIDTTYTAVAIGLAGFKTSDGSFLPAFGDGVGPHADTNNDTFPFLGAPH